ncbi:MAG: HNH endonuclease family protein, partial [Ignavibacteria bacterium]|nr:HNH endonuclease family protein [Ignavibacteria bacterium]
SYHLKLRRPQIYVQNSDNNQANDDIAEIQSIISKTYKYIEAVEGYFTENELLDNITATIEAIKERLNKETNKPQWISLFFEDFMEITYSAKSVIINKNQSEITNLFFVGNEVNWKLVLLTIFHKGEASGAIFKKILKLLEILSFKLKLGDYRTDYLPSYAKQYFSPKNDYDIKKLYEDIKKATEIGFKEYWNNGDAFENIILNYFKVQKHHYNRNTIKFVLWQYENSLRLKNGAGALLDKELYDRYTIEHIKPQTPKDEDYTEEFKKNFLHLAGNLALLTQEQNSKFGNESFSKKNKLFQDTALSSYTEIRNESEWKEFQITTRHGERPTFADV